MRAGPDRRIRWGWRGGTPAELAGSLLALLGVGPRVDGGEELAEETLVGRQSYVTVAVANQKAGHIGGIKVKLEAQVAVEDVATEA